MEINPRLFDKHGSLRLGRGSITCTRWHPLYPEQPYLAVGLSSGEIIILRVEHKPEERRIAIKAVQEFPPLPGSRPWDLDWGPQRGEDAGRYLAVAEGSCGFVRVLDVEENREQARFRIGHEVMNVVFSPDGTLLAVAGDLCPIRVLRFADGTVLHEIPSENRTRNRIAFHSDGRHLAVSNPFGILDVASGKWQPLQPHGQSATCADLSFSPDGRYLLTREMRDSESHLILRHGQTGNVDSTAFGGEPLNESFWGKSVWGSGSDRLHYWSWTEDQRSVNQVVRDVQSGGILRLFNRERGYNDSVSPDGSFIAVAKKEQGAHSLRFTLVEDTDVSGHWEYGGEEENACFSPCGIWVIARSGEGFVWRVLPNLRLGRKCCDKNLLHTADPLVTPDAWYVLLLQWGGPILRYKAREHCAGTLLEGHECTVHRRAISPDARYLVSCSKSGDYRGVAKTGKLLLHDLTTGKRIPGFAERAGLDMSCETDLIITTDGRHVVCTTARHTTMLSLPEGRALAKTAHTHVQWRLFAVSPDGAWFVHGTRYRLLICEAESGRERASFELRDTGYVGCVAFSPCGRWLSVVGPGGTVLLSTEDWRTRVTFDERYQNSYSHVVFSPDGRYLALSGQSSTILDLERVLGAEWFTEYRAAPLILTAVWFPKGSLDYLRETDQGTIVTDRPLARCGECGRFFPVEDTMLGQEVRCPNEMHGRRCNRLLKLNFFIAGFQDPEVC